MHKIKNNPISSDDVVNKKYVDDNTTTKQDKTDNTLDTTDKTVTGAINEVNGNQLDTVGFSADYKNIILNRKNGLNPYTIPISAIIHNAKLIELNDIDSTNIGDGKTLVYDGATKKHKYVDSTGTDEFVKMDSTTDAKHLSELIDKSTIVNDNGTLKVKKLDGQEVTIAEINYLKGLTMNVMDLVNAFANGGVKVWGTPVNTYADLSTLDRSSFLDGISYIVYVLADETHSGAKTTYLCDKTSETYFGNADSQRNFTTDPIDLTNEVTGKLGASNIDVDALWKLLTINDTYKTLTTKNEPFGTHGAKALYDELVADIGKKANATDLTNHTGDTDIHVTSAERILWNTVSNKVNKSGDTMTGTLTIKKSGDDATLLTFDTERTWSFKQGGTGASASLDLVSSGNDKKFRILNTDKTKGLEVHTGASATSVRIDGNKVITEDQLQGYIPYFPKTIQFGHTVTATNNSKWVKIFEFTPNEYAWNGGNFIITFSSLNTINSYYRFGEYELIWKCNSSGADGITYVYLNQIISQNGDVCHTRGSGLCVGISENKKTVGLYAFLGVTVYQTMLATIISGGSRYENNQSEIAKWINIDKPTVGLEAQPTFSKANYYSLADNLGGWTYTATKLPVLNYTDVE